MISKVTEVPETPGFKHALRPKSTTLHNAPVNADPGPCMGTCTIAERKAH